MDRHYDPIEDESYKEGRKIIMHPLYLPKSSPWLDLKVFYVRVSNCEVDESIPNHLTLNHVPLTPETIIEMNGRRSSIYSDWVSSTLRRDRIDKKSEEVTFVSTDCIRISGSVRFEVYDKKDLLLTGVLELSNGNGYTGEPRGLNKKWSMKCQSVVSSAMGFLKAKQYGSPEVAAPTIEVYVTGCFSSNPIILTQTVQLGLQKKSQMQSVLDSIPENETTEQQKKESKVALKLAEYQGYNQTDTDVDYNSFYRRAEYMEGEDGELSWFNAGVRVGVGIGLGICLGVGIGVGVLVRTYQATTGNFRRRLI